MKYRFEPEDYGLDDENRDLKRDRRDRRGKRGRDSVESRDRKWERWN
jgi:hypothetical protein